MLSEAQASKISPDDLARMILGILQERATMDAQRLQAATSYDPTNLGGIRETIFPEGGYTDYSYERNQVVKIFREKYDQSVQLLYARSLIFKDPNQRSDTFALLTERGKLVDVNAPVFGVTNTDGYIAAVRGAGGPMDAVVEGYLRESYSAAEADLWLSATFMLGAASERLLFITSEHVDALLKDAGESAKLAHLWKARAVKEWIAGHLPTLRKAYPPHKSAFTDVEDVLETLVSLYRYQRNETGHPKDTMPNIDPTHIKAMILTFGTWQTRVAAILEVQP